MFRELELKGYDRLRNMLDPKNVDKAARMATNTAITRGKAEAARAIYARWNMKKSDINRATQALKATAGGRSAMITVKGRPMSLTYFGAKWYRGRSVTTRQRSSLRRRATGRSGVFVDIMRGGDTTHKPHAFIAAMRSGHIGVFERIPGSKMRGKNKEQIVERKTITMASMFGQPEVMDPTLDRIQESLDNEFPRLIGVLFGDR
jgi:hypothetical protein